MELDIEQENIDLVKNAIVSNKKYIENEDLFDEFFNETCKRALSVIKTIKNEASLKIYLDKIATTSILQVLIDNGRIRNNNSLEAKGFSDKKQSSSIKNNGKYADVTIDYNLIDLEDDSEEFEIKKDILQHIYDAIIIANSTEPAKQFLTLYDLRYVKGMKQKQIAQELNISPDEVSERLLELMKLVKVSLNNGLL